MMNRARSTAPAQIPVARPRLPAAAAVMPYLAEIDAARVYSNHGPLVRRLEARLAEHYGTPSSSVLSLANATLGLTLALQAQGARKGSLCLLPGWTFAASAHAAVLAGLKPHFVDVDPRSWAMTPEIALRALAQRPGRVGAVMPVAPFGQILDPEPWDRFAEQTRLPVVIDAAAAFDSVQASNVPAVVSLHATKVLGAGEGGFVLSRDRWLITEIQRRSNFGFSGSREARVAATNAKMSEYHAAVGLAALEEWTATRLAFERVAGTYQRLLQDLPAVGLQPGHGRDWVSATCMLRFDDGLPLDDLAGRLAGFGIGTRRWWPRVLTEENAFARCSADALPVARLLADRVLGLPCYADLTDAEILRVCRAIEQAVQPHGEAIMLPAATPAARRTHAQPALR